MKVTERRFTWQGEEFRVLVVGDVVSVPGYAGAPGWSMGGFGAGSMSIEWLLHSGGLPGPARRRRAVAEMIVYVLAAHNEGEPTALEPGTRGPYVRCPSCKDSGLTGWVVAPPDYKGPVLQSEGLCR